MSTKTCLHCGQPLLPVGGLPLTPLEWKFYETVRDRPGLTANDLRVIIWDDEKGGPESFSNLRARACKMNKKLRGYGLSVRAERAGGWRPRWFVFRINSTEAA